MILIVKQDKKITPHFKIKWKYIMDDNFILLECIYSEKWENEINELINNTHIFDGVFKNYDTYFTLQFSKTNLNNFNSLIDSIFDI